MSNSLTTIQKYYICNQDIIKNRSREYYQLNKTEFNKRRLRREACQCGVVICHAGMKRHCRTIQHTNWLLSNVKIIQVNNTKL